jgi:hypothetical protein
MMPGLLASLGVLLMVTQVMAGAWTSHGFFYKPAMGARGEQEKTSFDSGLERVDTRLANEKWLNDPVYGGNLQAAITAIGNNPTILRLPAGIHSIDANLTIPANVTLKPERGAVFAIANTKTLTINGPLDARPYQIFNCVGTGKVVFGLGAVDKILPQWWGASGAGTADDTVAIEAAWAACWVTPPEAGWLNYVNPTLYFLPGRYDYNGTGLARPTAIPYGNISIRGDNPGAARIVINSDAYLIDTDFFTSFRMSGLNVASGKGAFRTTATAANTTGETVIEDCWFYAYTECAIGMNATDQPNVKIRTNLFQGASGSDTIGVALGGLTDGSEITGNEFTSNKYHIKHPQAGGGNINNNVFFRWWPGDPDPSYDIWIIPTVAYGAYGLNITNNKFGSENWHANDVHILIADEGVGTYNSDKHHAISASTGYVGDLNVKDNNFAITSNSTSPIIYSYTPNVYNLVFDNKMPAEYTTSVIGFAAALADGNPYNRQSVFSYRQVFNGMARPVFEPSSDIGLGYVDDPHGYLEGRLGYPHFYPGAGTDPSYVNLLAGNNVTLNFTEYLCTTSDVTDSVGGANATTVTFTDAGGMFHHYVDAGLLVAGRSGFIEFDIKAAGANPLTEIEVGAFNATWVSSTNRVLKIPATWSRVRIPFTTRGTTAMHLRFIPYGYAAGKTSVTIGRPAIYYAQEPVNLGAAPQVGLKVLTAAPGTPYAGMIVIANRATWDPVSKGSGGPYPVWYNGSAWKLLNEQ